MLPARRGSKAAPHKQTDAKSSLDAKKAAKRKKWELQTYVAARDFTGALTLLAFEAKHGKSSSRRTNALWSAYCHFYLGEYELALQQLDSALAMDEEETDADHGADVRDYIHLQRACCYLYLHELPTVHDVLTQSLPPTLRHETLQAARYRLELVLAQREDKSMTVASRLGQLLTANVRDQLAAAAILFRQRNFQGAMDIYKRLASRDEGYAAVQVYLAMCYYNLEFYDVSLEMLNNYLSLDPHSVVAQNLRACNVYHLTDGFVAEQSVALSAHVHKTHVLLEHNIMAFRDTEYRLAVWTSLFGIVPEALLNAAIFHLKQRQMRLAYHLLESLEPSTPIEYALKGVVHSWKGQSDGQGGTDEHLFLAEKFFETVGASPSECDTIRGRQCMASFYMLRKEFETAVTYLKSISMYHVKNDAFNWNYGMALAAMGCYSEAESVLTQIQDPAWKHRYLYCAWLARCHIRSIQQSHLAWEIYLNMQDSNDALELLKLIAHEFYLMADYFFAAKAFDVLERVDPDPEYWEAKRGACVGYFNKSVTGKCDPVKLQQVLTMLESSKHHQGKGIARTLRHWCEAKTLLPRS
ncbi:hypothetical protein SDRG_05896 [Saprolegnia diclina VS20]|uniref:Uncharacterized protein n=1 Tax=Saprolegnia diclina (strain VS20) TaxID=1156394 RepID=T0QEU8_SAPDV|nr:hypothetical protein SDRG_05896 [Saprolegnia diclina VS20]EQC36439.1 hypothetical protein SDRG_05896 [Saprolegnia diclina VS20]|eukprot:XP_008609860.1 hypothetical protein SDRG_05896 [Saprolegnia diclina VS20]